MEVRTVEVHMEVSEEVRMAGMDIDHHLRIEDMVWDIVHTDEDVWGVCLDV